MTDSTLSPGDLATREIGKLISWLQDRGVPDLVITESFLWEVVWTIQYMASDPECAAKLRGLINWFSGECRDLVQAPQGGDRGTQRHRIQH